MRKTDLVSVVKDKAGLTKDGAEKAVNAVFEAIGDELKNGGSVQLIGFGTFETRERKEREGRNPRDPQGPKIKIAACKAPVFKAGKALKDAVNK